MLIEQSANRLRVLQIRGSLYCCEKTIRVCEINSSQLSFFHHFSIATTHLLLLSERGKSNKCTFLVSIIHPTSPKQYDEMEPFVCENVPNFILHTRIMREYRIISRTLAHITTHNMFSVVRSGGKVRGRVEGAMTGWDLGCDCE